MKIVWNVIRKHYDKLYDLFLHNQESQDEDYTFIKNHFIQKLNKTNEIENNLKQKLISYLENENDLNNITAILRLYSLEQLMKQKYKVKYSVLNFILNHFLGINNGNYTYEGNFKTKLSWLIKNVFLEENIIQEVSFIISSLFGERV